MYTIIGFDILNGGRTTKKFCKPKQVETLKDINIIQERIQLKQQAKYTDPITVYIFYRIPKHLHIKHEYKDKVKRIG
jgi:hypothetical protein